MPTRRCPVPGSVIAFKFLFVEAWLGEIHRSSGPRHGTWMNRFALLATAALAASFAPAIAQEAPPPADSGASSPAAAASPDDVTDEETIIVQGTRPHGSVIGDIPAENVLTSRDVRATGATSISELLDAVAAQTGSARGRGGGGPILLLDGQRISGFRELRDLPPEAIERMEILPEEVALKYGYSADQRVVNIVLRRRFNSTSLEAGTTLATEGGYASGKADATRLTIANGTRTSLNAHLEGNGVLTESEREIAFDPASGPDARSARSLIGAGQSARVTATLKRTILGDVGATVTAEADHSKNRSLFGLSPFEPGDPLARNSATASAGLGVALNTQRGKWRLSSTANAQLDRIESDADRSLLTALSDDRSRSTRTAFALDGTASGPLFALPAGDANATFKLGASRLDLDGAARRRDLVSTTNLGRTEGDASVSVDLPLSKRTSRLGRLGANLNAGVSQLSDFGTLTSLGAGLTWVPAPRATLLASVTREQGAPTLSVLGNPLLETDNVPFFDATTGQTANVTTLTGGNPALLADRRTVMKFGGNWQPSETLDLKLRADFVHESIDRPQVSFPAASPALEAAFPARFRRDAEGKLVRVDLRPVNADHSTRNTLRLGFDFTRPLKSKPPSAPTLTAMRARLNAARPPGETPSPPRDGEGRGFGGGGGGGRGGFGRRDGGRLTLSTTDTITFTDRLTITPGLAALDYLDGEALGANGGRPRHQVEVEGGYFNNGLGARVTTNWRSPTRVNGGLSGNDLRFSSYATVSLRLFANLGQMPDLVTRHPFLRGSSFRFDFTNLFNSKPNVRGGDGNIPFAYQPDRLDPIGRTVGISFRKLFLPARLFNGGGGRRGGGD